MATFQYQALTTAGRLMTGTLEAASHDQVNEMLQEMQLDVNSITQAQPEKAKTAIGRNEFILFNQQLASLTKAGVPLEKGLRELAADVGIKSMRKLINDLASDLEAGEGIEAAFEKRQKHFPPLYGQILKAGVKTGRLSEMLISLNRHLEITQHTRRMIFEAMCYPLVILAMAAVILTAVFTMIIPQYASLIADMDVAMPVLTKFFIGAARHFVTCLAVLGATVLAFFLLRSVLSGFVRGRCFKERLLMKIPFLGRVYRNSILSRLADAMALLIGSGCDIPECLRLGAGASGSEKLKQECELLAGQIEQGFNIMEAGQLCSMIPRLFLYSVQLGAQRNELQNNLYSLSEMYVQQAKSSQMKLSVVLLPLMLILVGGILATAVMAMFLPMVRMIGVLS